MKSLVTLLLAFFSLPLFAGEIPALPTRVEAHVLRLAPGEDPKLVLEAYVRKHNLRAASVASAVGSVTKITLRYANEPKGTVLEGFREIVSLSGTISNSNTHLHASVSDRTGETRGGHLLEGSKVYTTLEIVLLAFPDVEFARKKDPTYGHDELSVEVSKPTPPTR